jgi:SAM-dependent methyltransferase
MTLPPLLVASPHDNWAKFYDFVYEQTFGDFYQRFTTMTLDAINQIIPHGIIFDFGAGTGRLTIPLAQRGYQVEAIEKSLGMVSELKRKSEHAGVQIPAHHCSIAEFTGGKADLALALFTVLPYLITEDELENSIQHIGTHLKQNAYFFFDIPDNIFFENECLIKIDKRDFHRSIRIIAKGSSVYQYSETCHGIFFDQPFQYEDAFSIRRWNYEEVDSLLHSFGLSAVQCNLSRFHSSGSTYHLFLKK